MPKETSIEELKERLYSKIERKEMGCWEWVAHINKQGYGASCFRGTTITAHRLSYVLHKGDIPKGLIVCHTCDNRKCINPDHLYAGTYLQNARDTIDRGRINCTENGLKTISLGYGFKKGDRRNTRKLTDKRAAEIKNILESRFENGRSIRSIAIEENVSRTTLVQMIKGKVYQDI